MLKILKQSPSDSLLHTLIRFRTQAPVRTVFLLGMLQGRSGVGSRQKQKQQMKDHDWGFPRIKGPQILYETLSKLLVYPFITL